MRVPDPKANTTTEAYLAYKAGYLEQSELKPVLYEPYLHFDAWLAYWAGLVPLYPIKAPGKNIFNKYGLELGVNWSNIIGISLIDSKSIYSARAVILVPVKPNTTYTISLEESEWYCMEVDEADKYGVVLDRTVRTASNEFSETITTLDGVYMLGLKFKYGSAGTTAITKDMLSELKMQIEEGNSATEYEDYTGEPEMLTDEEALVAYLAGVTNTYPEEIKDPYDVRIVGYLRHLASIRWPEPDYPVNNEEFYLSTMEPTHTSNPVPSSNIEQDTVEGKIISVEAYGNTYQQTYTGKNLIDFGSGAYTSGGITATRDGNTVTVTGKRLSTVNYMFFTSGTINFGGVVPAGTYTLSIASPVSKQLQVSLKDSDGNSVGLLAIPVGETSITGTISEDVYSFRAAIAPLSYDEEIDVVFQDIQLEAGSAPTAFEPYVGGIPAPNPQYPQDVHVVTGEQTVTVNGKNLFDKNIVALEKNWTGAIGTVCYPFQNSQNRAVVLIPVKPNTTYTLKLYSSEWYMMERNEVDSSYVVVARNQNINRNEVTATITTTAQTNYVGVKFKYGSAGTTVPTPDLLNELKMQLEVGSTPTPYEPYQGQSYPISLGSIELCKIGDYQDYIYKNGSDWYVHKVCGKVLLGNLAWRASQTNVSGMYRMDTADLDGVFVSPDTINIPVNGISSHFLAVPASSLGTYGAHVGISAVPNGRNVYIYSEAYNTSSSAADFKTWLADNNVAFYYALATPTDTKITDATLVGQLEALANADTYNEKTYIKVTANDPNLPALLKVEAYKY